MIIGFNGYAKSGKDTVASALVARYGFQRRAFADKLRKLTYAVLPDVDEAVRVLGYERAKDLSFVREALQRVGTEGGRMVFGDNFWVDQALTGVTYASHVVLTDTRFPNEAQAIKDLGGYVVKIVRPGVGAANDHISEHALDDYPFDAVIVNDGAVINLYEDKLTKLWTDLGVAPDELGID